METTYKNNLLSLAKEKDDEVAKQNERLKMEHGLHQVKWISCALLWEALLCFSD